MRDRACAVQNWSCLERNRVKSECFRERKRVTRPAGREPYRIWVPGKIDLWNIGGHSFWLRLVKVRVVWAKANFLAAQSAGKKCLWVYRRSSESCKGVFVCVCT